MSYTESPTAEQWLSNQLANAKKRQPQRTVFDEPKFKFTPAPAPAAHPTAIQLAELNALSETNPRKKFTLACSLLSWYEKQYKAQITGSSSINARNHILTKRNFWKDMVESLLLEII